MADRSLTEQQQNNLSKIASFCPLNTSSQERDSGVDGNNSDNGSRCTWSDFVITAGDVDKGLHYSCRNAKEGLCSGYLNSED